MRISDWSSDVCSSDLTEKISALLDPTVKTIVHIPSVNSRESLKDKHREAEDIMNHLGDWQGIDPETGFHLIKTAAGNVIKVADLVDDAAKRDRVAAALKSPNARDDRDFRSEAHTSELQSLMRTPYAVF